MKKHLSIIIVVIILANMAVLATIHHLPIPPGKWAEVYYSPLFLKQAVGNMVLALGSAFAKEWKLAMVLGFCSIVTFVIAASA